MHSINQIFTKLLLGVTIILALWAVNIMRAPLAVVQARQVAPRKFVQSHTMTEPILAKTHLATSAPITGLVAYYPFHGQANDASGHHNDAVVSGPVLTTDRFEQVNSAYLFDGNDDFMTVADSTSLDITAQITLATWIYPQMRKSQKIMVKGQTLHGNTAAPYELSLSGSGDIIFSLRPGLQFTQSRQHGYNLNQWIFVAGTYDGSAMKLYVNGNLTNIQNVAGPLNSNNDELLIGTRLKIRSDTFNGKIDDIRIYNRALSTTEIQTLYNLGKPSLSTFLPVILR